ncbi:MAG: hypothetical protein ACREBE_18620 [bacterium]
MRLDDDDLPAYDDDQLAAFAELPREAPLAEGETDRMVRRLESEGFFRRSSRVWRTASLAAAAVLLFALGAAIGSHVTRRGSLEDMLARRDLTTSDRILLLQRAGSAYVRAAQGYADATARVDSTAVEVASQVLVGAANAVARHSLDAGMATRLAAALQPSSVVPVAAQRKPIIWF